MNENQITDRLVAAHTALVGKLCAQPYFPSDLRITSGGRVNMSLYGPHSYDAIKSFSEESFAACLDTVDAFIAAMPDPVTAKLHNHMRRVADCIDKGREDGIDDAYIAPLVVVKAAMTENLLTHSVAAE